MRRVDKVHHQDTKSTKKHEELFVYLSVLGVLVVCIIRIRDDYSSYSPSQVFST